MIAVEQVYQPTVNIILNGLPAEHRPTFDHWLMQTAEVWVGHIDDELVCLWGVVHPTLLSTTAYIWLYTTPAIVGNEFLFVRQSQRLVEDLLKRYDQVMGHTKIGEDRSMRWLRLLGAKYGEPFQGLIPFSIEKKHG